MTRESSDPFHASSRAGLVSGRRSGSYQRTPPVGGHADPAAVDRPRHGGDRRRLGLAPGQVLGWKKHLHTVDRHRDLRRLQGRSFGGARSAARPGSPLLRLLVTALRHSAPPSLVWPPSCLLYAPDDISSSNAVARGVSRASSDHLGRVGKQPSHERCVATCVVGGAFSASSRSSSATSSAWGLQLRGRSSDHLPCWAARWGRIAGKLDYSFVGSVERPGSTAVPLAQRLGRAGRCHVGQCSDSGRWLEYADDNC